MKILVPTDFSECAEYALDAAVKLSIKLKAEIHLIHIVETQPNLIHEDSNKVDKANLKLDQLIEQIKSKEIIIKSVLRHGSFINELALFLKQENYELVVMGSQGASGKREWLIGSNTQKVLRKLHQNVVIIKHKMDKIDFSEVLFVTGLDQKDKEALKYFLDFIEPFNVKEVHILSVNTTSFFSQPTLLMLEVLKDFKKIAEGYEVQTHFYSDFSIDAGVRHFCDEYGIDLVSISHHVRHPIKRILQGSNVEIIVNHSAVPVLSIDY